MESLLSFLSANPWYGLFLIFVFFIWILIVTLVLLSVVTRYNRLTRNTRSQEVKDIFLMQQARLNDIEENLGKLSKIVAIMENENQKHLQRVSLVRFNPFSDTGGDQSFAIALLDNRGDGVVFSSLHGREGTRVYAKSVKGFKSSGHEFSKEELEVIIYAAKS